MSAEEHPSAHSTAPKAPASTPVQVAAAWSVHLLTLSGIAWACLAMIALLHGELVQMWLWLGIALVVDSVDGTLARKADVQAHTPGFDGTVLDIVVDYLTWTFIPALFMYLYLPFGADWWATTAFVLICVSSAFCYCNVSLKTPDNYFMGFPAAWNIVAVALWILGTGAVLNTVITLALAALTVAPLAFVHPFRVARLMPVNIIAALGWIATSAVLVSQHPEHHWMLLTGWWACGGWLLLISGIRTVQGLRPKRSDSAGW